MDSSQINVVDTISQSISTIFSNLFSSIDSNIYYMLDDLIFIDTDIITSSPFSTLIGETSGFNMITLCNALIGGFVLYYGLSYLLSHLTFASTSKPSQFIFKLLLCVFFVNSSFFIAKEIIFIFSSISLSIRSIGEHAFNTQISFSNLISNFNSIIYTDNNNFNIFSLDGLFKCFISFGFFNLILTYSLRYVMLQVFLLLSPFAFLSLSLENTSWIFKSWVKVIFSLLFIQIFISTILLVCFSFQDFSSNIAFSKFIYIGSIFALIKANLFVRDFVGGLSTDINVGISALKSYFSGGA